jgi:hypothetical protein
MLTWRVNTGRETENPKWARRSQIRGRNSRRREDFFAIFFNECVVFTCLSCLNTFIFFIFFVLFSILYILVVFFLEKKLQFSCVPKCFLKNLKIFYFIFKIILMCWCQKLFSKNYFLNYFNIFLNKKIF